MNPWLILAGLVLAGAVVLVARAVRPLRRAAPEVDQIIADARAHTKPLLGTGPDPDQTPGFDIELHDQCELIFSLPEYDPELAAGCDRLWDAVCDEQQKNGDTDHA